MTGMGQDALDDAVPRYHNSSSIDALAAKKRRVVESSLAGRRAFSSCIKTAVVQDKDPSFRSCCERRHAVRRALLRCGRFSRWRPMPRLLFTASSLWRAVPLAVAPSISRQIARVVVVVRF